MSAATAPDLTGAAGSGDVQRSEAGDSARTMGKVRRSTGQSTVYSLSAQLMVTHSGKDERPKTVAATRSLVVLLR